MTEQMTHEQYVHSCRIKAARIAASVVAGTVPVLQGCCELDQLRASVEVADDDADFQIFNLVQSETEGLPIGELQTHWSTDALAKLGPELQSASSWASSIALPACRSVVARFGA